jgi:pimeloyl-ACP methyl ester carboxylesterase
MECGRAGPDRHAGAISGSRLIVLDDCGHFAYLEQPDRVRAAIAELLAPD